MSFGGKKAGKVQRKQTKKKRTSSNGSTYSTASSRRKTYYNKFDKGAVGLKNEGNTCYFNSLLQAVMNVDSFVLPLMRGDYEDEKDTEDVANGSYFFPAETKPKKSTVTTEFIRMLESVHIKEQYWALSTKPLRRALAKYNSEFTDGYQHDSWPSLGYLLSALADEWQQKNPIKIDPTCPVYAHFTVPFHIGIAVEEKGMVTDIRQILVNSNIIEKPIACFCGISVDTLICHNCNQPSKQVNVERAIEVSWGVTGCEVFLTLADTNGIRDWKTIPKEAGLKRECIMGNVTQVMNKTLDIKDRYRYYLWKVFKDDSSQDKTSSLTFHPINYDDKLSDFTNRSSAVSLFGAELSAGLSESSIRESWLVFSIVLDEKGRYIHKPDNVRHFALVSERLFEAENFVRFLLNQMIYGPSEMKTLTQSSYEWFAIHDQYRVSELNWNYVFPKDDHSHPIFLIGVHPNLSAEIPLIGHPGCVLAEEEARYCSEISRNIRRSINGLWKFNSRSAPVQVKYMVNRESLRPIEMIDCIKVSESPQECWFPESRCRNEECTKSGLTFTRTRQMILPPEVLVCHLNRDVNGTTEKDNSDVNCPHHFEFKNVWYGMVGATKHSSFSRSTFSGHYTAVAKNMHNGKWFEANDSLIVGKGSHIGPIFQANLVIYQKCKPPKKKNIERSTDLESETTAVASVDGYSFLPSSIF